MNRHYDWQLEAEYAEWKAARRAFWRRFWNRILRRNNA
jgi:hypothetical protein